MLVLAIRLEARAGSFACRSVPTVAHNDGMQPCCSLIAETQFCGPKGQIEDILEWYFISNWRTQTKPALPDSEIHTTYLSSFFKFFVTEKILTFFLDVSEQRHLPSSNSAPESNMTLLPEPARVCAISRAASRRRRTTWRALAEPEGNMPVRSHGRSGSGPSSCTGTRRC